MTCSKIWLIPLVDGRQCSRYITKSDPLKFQTPIVLFPFGKKKNFFRVSVFLGFSFKIRSAASPSLQSFVGEVQEPQRDRGAVDRGHCGLAEPNREGMKPALVSTRCFFSCSWVLVDSRKYKDLLEVHDLEQCFHCQYHIVEILAVLINKHSIKLVFLLSIHVVLLKGWLSLIAMWIRPSVLCSHAVYNMLRTGQIYRECRIP